MSMRSSFVPIRLRFVVLSMFMSEKPRSQMEVSTAYVMVFWGRQTHDVWRSGGLLRFLPPCLPRAFLAAGSSSGSSSTSVKTLRLVAIGDRRSSPQGRCGETREGAIWDRIPLFPVSLPLLILFGAVGGSAGEQYREM